MYTMGASMKMRGWNQSLMAQSSTQKESLGILRTTDDGRWYRYAKNGAGALTPGMLNYVPGITTAHMNQTCAAAAIGDYKVTVTVTAGTAIAANALTDGYLQVNAGTGLGYSYLIASNTAITTAGTTVYVDLAEPIRVALTTSSFVTLMPNPQSAVIQNATATKMAAGVSPKPVTISYYFWNQVWGPGEGLMGSNAAVGCMLIGGAVAGSFTASATDSQATTNWVGRQGGTVGVDTEYKPIFIMIG